MTGSKKIYTKESLKKVNDLYNDQPARPVKAVAASSSVATTAKKAKGLAGIDTRPAKRVKQGRVPRREGVGGGRGGGVGKAGGGGRRGGGVGEAGGGGG